MTKIRDFFASLKKSTKITLISCVSFVLMTFIILCFFILSPITPDDKAGHTFGRESVSPDGSTVSDVTTSGDGDSLEVSKGTTNTTAYRVTTTHEDYVITVTSGDFYMNGRIITGDDYGNNSYGNDNNNSYGGGSDDDDQNYGNGNGNGNGMDIPEDQYAGNGSGGDNYGGNQGNSGETENPNSNENGNNNNSGGDSGEAPQQQTEQQQNVPPQVNPDDLPANQTPAPDQSETPPPAEGGGESAGREDSE